MEQHDKRPRTLRRSMAAALVRKWTAKIFKIG
jgi:hypothetical protein